MASKRLVPRLNDLTAAESVDFFQTVIKVQKFLSRIHNATSVTVTVQDGEDAGQTVKHVHCHIMPRHKGDFEHNDMIYTELQKHDHEKDLKRRDLSEMVAEAESYRKFISEEGI